jgi:hypothetical protein
LKIIISHDVDHLYWYDHLYDTWWFGLIKRTSCEVLKGDLPLSTATKRLFPRKNIHHVMELCEFLGQNNIPTTFFFGMKKGLNLSYNYVKAKPVLNFVQSKDFHIGVHGIAFNDRSLMALERQRFTDLTGLEPEGIRIHYLQMDSSTHYIMDDLGYRYDSTERKIDFPRKIGKLWSIPISVMDVDVIHGSRQEHLLLAINETKIRIEMAETMGIPYFVINFHDLYFSSSYPNHVAWFKWLLEYLMNDKYEFISFNSAIELLNS